MLRRKLANRKLAAHAAAASQPTPSTPDSEARQVFNNINLSPLSTESWFSPKTCGSVLIVLLLHLTGLYLFASGFLLTRLELENRSICAPFAFPSLSSPTPPNTTTPSCWHPKRFDRAVLIIIDALRYDFTIYNETLSSQGSTSTSNSSIPYYLNRLPIFQQTLQAQPHHALSLRARADPPTTTLQRIKAITTGTLPTFVDAGSNFFGQTVGEDNLLSQLLSQNKKITFMGDDTWINMFPNSLNESHPYPSFDVWDLHTVDNGVLEHLYPTLQKNSTEWDFLIAHFLGVDHAGHRYGPDHPAMGDKLTQMNGMLERVFEMAPEDAVVVVMGDHGMDPKGDHGGDSENEVNAGMFIYSKRPLVDVDGEDDGGVKNLLERSYALDVGSDEPFVYLDGLRTLPQIDLVPTLALLLGLPVPFGNLGTVIPDLFLGGGRSGMRNLLEVARLNALQIHTYLVEYSKQRMAASLALGNLNELFESAEKSCEALAVETADVETLREAYLRYLKFTRRALVTARQIWARFDLPLIVMGSVVLILGMLSIAVWAGVYLSRGEDPSYVPSFVGAGIGAILGAIGFVNYFAAQFEAVDQSGLKWYHEVLFGGALGLMIPFLATAIYHFTQLARTSPLRQSLRSPSLWLSTLLLTLHYLKPASDSFTIHEDSITVYIIQIFGLFNLVRSFRLRDDKIRDQLVLYSLAFMMLTRISQISTICREEQHPYCVPTFNASPTTSVAAPEVILALWVMIAAVRGAGRKLLKGADNAEGAGFVGPSVFVPLALVIAAGYWTLDFVDNLGPSATENSVLSSLSAGTVKVYWAKFGYTFGAITPLYLWASDPNCTSLEIVEVKYMDGTTGKRLCVNGVSNAVGAGWFVFLMGVYAVLVMYAKPMGGVMLGVGFLQVMCLCEMVHLWRDRARFAEVVEKKGRKKALPVELLAKVGKGRVEEGDEKSVEEAEKGVLEVGLTFSYLAVLALLAHRYYFATGHQATLSTIQWDVGLIGMLKVNWITSPLMVALNTFASHIFFALAAPLMVLWKRPVLSNTEARFEVEARWVLVAYLAVVGAGGSVAAVFAGHFRRHLMVWRVFAPRFLFGGVEILVVDFVVFVGGVGALWICRKGFNVFLIKLREKGVLE